MTVSEVVREVICICKEYEAKEVILFGSRAKDTATERSDIDIAVRGADDFESLEERIADIPTLYTVDMVDMDRCKNSLLMEDIERYGRKIYEKI
ncbi:MAG: nucleotidyltransferase domain-containing protein [Clostridiales bacterium]|nr:nucleotidyltransferase domain-containing protein [Clostridiales bacterium]